MNNCAIILENAGVKDIVIRDDGKVDATIKGQRFIGLSLEGIENGDYEDEDAVSVKEATYKFTPYKDDTCAK